MAQKRATAGHFADALKRTEELELTVTGRKSGKKIANPVWFVHEGRTLWLVPVHGSDSDWYHNVVEHPEITLGAGGEKLHASTTPVTDVATVREVVDKFRGKYGAGEVKKYYGKPDVAVKVPLG